MTKYLTKKQVMQIFKEEVLPEVIKQYGKDDKIAQSEAWNNFTDMLCKDRKISLRQYETWSNPY